MKLTSAEIKDLAEMAGFTVNTHEMEMDQEFTVQDCPAEGIKDEDGTTVRHYAHIAWDGEYPEEGVMPLGEEIQTGTAHELNEECWCKPEVDYVDPVSGAMVVVHRDMH